MGEMQTNKIEYVDVVSKPVGITYEKVQILGIYCWPHGENEKRAAFFLPRLSFNTNTEYLKKLYPSISKDKDLKGKGIFTSLWKIEKFYNKVSILHPEEVLSNDFVTLSAFKAWVETDPNLNEKKQKNEEEFLQVYALTDEARFAKYKCTEVQNSAATAYYSLKEILESEDMLESRA